MTRAGLALLIALTACSKSAPKRAVPSVDPLAVEPCEEPKNPSCPRTACGANSEALNNFPTNGARSDGECNKDGVQLMPGMMTGGSQGKCQDATLAIRDNKLVGLDPKTSSVKCSGNDLKGATFVLRSWVKKDGKYRSLDVHIAEIDPAYHADANQHARTAYRLTDNEGRSLCSTTGSTEARQTLGIETYPGLTEPTSGRDMVIPIRSELYNRDGHPWPVDTKWKLQEAEWLQFACVDDALAKRALYNLDTDDVIASRSALMMFMANYCGDLHATSRGAEIHWEMFDDSITKPSDSHPLEAKWGPDGALCMSNPRALFQAGEEAQVPQNAVGDLAQIANICPNCTPAAWADAVRSCEAWKTKHPAPPAIPKCDDCKSDGCQGVLLHSFVIPKTAP